MVKHIIYAIILIIIVAVSTFLPPINFGGNTAVEIVSTNYYTNSANKFDYGLVRINKCGEKKTLKIFSYENFKFYENKKGISCHLLKAIDGYIVEGWIY